MKGGGAVKGMPDQVQGGGGGGIVGSFGFQCIPCDVVSGVSNRCN